MGYDGMKGYCWHITHLSVVSDFDILIFCLFLFLFVCTSYCADFAREIWSNLSEEQLLFCIFVKTIHFQHQQAYLIFVTDTADMSV